MELEEESEVIDMLIYMNSMDRRRKGNEAVAVPKDVMNSVRPIHNMDLRNMVKKHEMHHGGSLR